MSTLKRFSADQGQAATLIHALVQMWFINAEVEYPPETDPGDQLDLLELRLQEADWPSHP